MWLKAGTPIPVQDRVVPVHVHYVPVHQIDERAEVVRRRDLQPGTKLVIDPTSSIQGQFQY